jgi:hypothetical protein
MRLLWGKISLTPWGEILLEKPTVSKPLREFPAFCGNRRTLTCLREPATGLYPEPDESNRHPPILFPFRHSLILSSALGPGVPNGLFSWDPTIKTVFALLFCAIRATCFARLSLIWWIWSDLVRNSNDKAPRCVIFSGLLLHVPLTSKYSP